MAHNAETSDSPRLARQAKRGGADGARSRWIDLLENL